jgi:CPA2 family monovalent cation:H+ antiporter-2
MQSATFLQDLAVVLFAAGAAALLCHGLRQPKVLGYILAGLLLGPHTPPFSLIKDEAAIRTLADLGVIFLMFSLGLEFNLRRLRKVGTTAGVTGFLDVVVMVWLGYLLGRYMGWSKVESLFLGGMLCDSSTTILAKILHEMGRMRDKFAGIVVGITVVEDVLAIGLIAVLTGVAVTGTVDAGFLAARFWVLVVFLVAVTIVGFLTLPRFLNYVNRLESDELLVLAMLGVCFGVSLIAIRLELSLALGAVLVGAVASESRAGQRLGRLADPLRHTFSAVFFVAIGLMLDPATLWQYRGPVLAATALVLGGKFMMNTVGSLLTGHDVPTSVRVGAGMAQVGEFAFIIAALGVSLGATAGPVYQVGVGAAVLTTLVNPYWIRGADRLAAAIEESPVCRRCTACFALYGVWVDRIALRERNSAVRRAVRRSVIVMLVNTILISAVMGVAGYLARRPLTVFPSLATRPGLLAGTMWVIAMTLCLPMYVATVRKLQAVGMILAEAVLPVTLTTPWARIMRSFLANAILTAGLVLLLVLTVTLGSAMFPSKTVLVLMMIGVAAVAMWRWPRMVRVYAQAQGAVSAMLQGTPAAEKEPAAAGAQSAETLVELNVESAVIREGSDLVGRDLRTIRLRERTGVTLVGIARADRKITNPGPGERLLSGDRVLLLGDPDQIRAARALLNSRNLAGKSRLRV